MKEYLFSESELELIQFLKSNSPRKIWWEHIIYIFEYDYFYIELGIECAEKFNLGYAPEKKSEKLPISDFEQYVMIAKLKKINEKYRPHSTSELLVENQKISELNIVRTLLFHCPHTKSKEHFNLFNTDSYQINPNINIDEKFDVKRTFLVDVGLWIRTESKIINCFILENDDDFSTNSHCYQNVNLKDREKEIYDFIEV